MNNKIFCQTLIPIKNEQVNFVVNSCIWSKCWWEHVDTILRRDKTQEVWDCFYVNMLLQNIGGRFQPTLMSAVDSDARGGACNSKASNVRGSPHASNCINEEDMETSVSNRGAVNSPEVFVQIQDDFLTKNLSGSCCIASQYLFCNVTCNDKRQGCSSFK